MKGPSKVVIALGLLLLVSGVTMRVLGGPPKLDPAQAQLCRDRMQPDGADLVARCDPAAFASQMTATDAQAAARAIGAANTRELRGSALAMFCIGLGIAALVAGIVLSLRRA